MSRVRVDVIDAVVLQERRRDGRRWMDARVRIETMLRSKFEQWAGNVGRKWLAEQERVGLCPKAHRHHAMTGVGVQAAELRSPKRRLFEWQAGIRQLGFRWQLSDLGQCRQGDRG